MPLDGSDDPALAATAGYNFKTVRRNKSGIANVRALRSLRHNRSVMGRRSVKMRRSTLARSTPSITAGEQTAARQSAN
jgi:hypothetical protein